MSEISIWPLHKTWFSTWWQKPCWQSQRSDLSCSWPPGLHTSQEGCCPTHLLPCLHQTVQFSTVRYAIISFSIGGRSQAETWPSLAAYRSIHQFSAKLWRSYAFQVDCFSSWVWQLISGCVAFFWLGNLRGCLLAAEVVVAWCHWGKPSCEWFVSWWFESDFLESLRKSFAKTKLFCVSAIMKLQRSANESLSSEVAWPDVMAGSTLLRDQRGEANV